MIALAVLALCILVVPFVRHHRRTRTDKAFTRYALRVANTTPRTPRPQ